MRPRGQTSYSPLSASHTRTVLSASLPEPPDLETMRWPAGAFLTTTATLRSINGWKELWKARGVLDERKIKKSKAEEVRLV